jgi:hypothetical protein
MRLLILTMILAVAAIMQSPTSSAAQQLFCEHHYGLGCVPVTPETYQRCFDLALARGESAAWGERHRLNWFIYQCLAGTIPGSPRRGRRRG